MSGAWPGGERRSDPESLSNSADPTRSRTFWFTSKPWYFLGVCRALFGAACLLRCLLESPGELISGFPDLLIQSGGVGEGHDVSFLLTSVRVNTPTMADFKLSSYNSLTIALQNP